MPCDQIRLTQVALDRVDPGHMTAALTALGLSPRLEQDGKTIRFGRGETINCSTGQSQLAANRDVNEIKRAYSGQVVQATAKKFGWTQAGTKLVQGKTQTIYSKR